MPRICRHKYSLDGKKLSRDEIHCNELEANTELKERLSNGFVQRWIDYAGNRVLYKVVGDVEYVIFILRK